jgi:hypothetical protein
MTLISTRGGSDHDDVNSISVLVQLFNDHFQSQFAELMTEPDQIDCQDQQGAMETRMQTNLQVCSILDAMYVTLSVASS